MKNTNIIKTTHFSCFYIDYHLNICFVQISIASQEEKTLLV